MILRASFRERARARPAYAERALRAQRRRVRRSQERSDCSAKAEAGIHGVPANQRVGESAGAIPPGVTKSQSRIRLATAALLVVAAAALLAASPRQQQLPTFRAAVDLIAVDVQVVNQSGMPIMSIQPDRFSVTIDGRQRKVVSADLVRHAEGEVSPATTTGVAASGSGALGSNQWPASGPVGRTFVLAIDVGSFNVGDSRGAVKAARGFVDQLQPNDMVGVYSYPLGPRVDPTFDRAKVRHDLDSIVGGSQALHSQYHLSPAEVIDINAEMASLASRMAPAPTAGRGNQPPTALNGNETETIRRVQLRECGTDNDMRCVESIEQEAQAMAFFFEGEMTRAVTGLGELLQRLGEYPGRKTVVVLSAGMPVSDRLGGRPNIGDAARVLGEEAARANANVYALHLDSTYLQTFAAETRRSDKMPVSRERESVMMGRFLDQFADTSGGTMMRILVGSGEDALTQILRETSAYYLLGVAPVDSDRDGRTHRLKVKVDQRDVTVRSRTWVLVPKKRS